MEYETNIDIAKACIENALPHLEFMFRHLDMSGNFDKFRLEPLRYAIDLIDNANERLKHEQSDN